MSPTARNTEPGAVRPCRRSALLTPTSAARSGTDYCLYDKGGHRLGTFRTVHGAPTIEPHAPTLLLSRHTACGAD
jgi:hypothetical protein